MRGQGCDNRLEIRRKCRRHGAESRIVRWLRVGWRKMVMKKRNLITLAGGLGIVLWLLVTRRPGPAAARAPRDRSARA